MRSIGHTAFGDPAQVLTMTELPLPVPGPGEIRVKMLLSPIHNHDLWTVRGQYGIKPALPATGGSEACGVVDAVGEGVDSPKPGKRVVVSGVAGSWAEYFVAPAARAISLPDSISDEMGCQLVAMPLSALVLLEDLGLKSGDWMIQNAATGAVGKAIASIAASRGINVVCLVRREAGLEELRTAGIHHVVTTSQSGWADRVKAIVGDQPILRAVDSVGGEESGALLRLLADGGHLVSFGAMSGKPMELGAGDLIFKQATVTGFWLSKRLRTIDGTNMARMIGELFRFATTGVLKLPVDQIFDLADAKAAVTASVQPGRTGKVLIRGR